MSTRIPSESQISALISTLCWVVEEGANEHQQRVYLLLPRIQDKKNHNTFDMIFLDFEKKGYIKVLNDCIKLLKKGGVMIADNISHDYCKDFKEKIRGHKKLKTEIINIEDGLSCSVKV